MKKKTVFILALLLGVLPLGGCSMLFEEPSNLILPPASDQEEYVERTLINSFLGDGEHLEVPEDMENPEAILNVDIDGDKKDEKLAFWANKNGHEVGVMLMHQGEDGTWSVLDQIRQFGNGVDFFRLMDVDGDGKNEACVGIDVGGNNVLSVYHLNKDGFSEAAQIDYSYLDIVDINGDGDNTILCALNDYDDTAPTTTLTVFDSNEDMKTIYEKSFDGNCVAMQFGNVSTTERGLYLVRTSNYSDLNVELLLPNEENIFTEQLTSLVHYLNSATSRSKIISDVTGDGVLDVQSAIEPIETTAHNENDYLRIWKTWDGDESLKNVYGVLENSTDGYTFVLPENWLGSVHYQFVTEKGTSQVRFYDGNTSDAALTLYATSVEESDKMKSIRGAVQLGTSPSSQRVYYAVYNMNSFAGQLIDPDSIKQLFLIEGGQQNDE